MSAPVPSADSSTLAIVATPFADAATWTSVLWDRAMTANPALRGGVVDCFDLAPDGPVLVLVGDPVHAAIAALQTNTDVGQALRRWCDGARRLLRLAHQPGTGFLFVHAQEAAANPEGFAAQLQAWHAGLSGLGLAAVAAPAVDAASLALGRAALYRDREVERVSDEVLASCVEIPLPAGGGASQARHDPVARAWAEVSAIRSAAQAAQSNQKELQTQLQQARSELQAKVDRDLAFLESVAEDSLRLETQLARANEALSKRPPADDEPRWLELQLNQANEELDLLTRQLAHANRAIGSGNGFRAEALTIAGEQDTPPHRHADLQLQGFHVGQLTLPALSLRLLEHHGHPGLAVFESDADKPFLSAWRASGDEGGRRYMLLVPADPDGRDRLTALGSRDWSHLRAVVDGLSGALVNTADRRAAAWSEVAARLSSELANLAPRLRYDDVGVEVDSNETCIATVQNASFGERRLGDLRLRLRHADHMPTAHWLAPRAGEPVPLARWPVESSGRLLPAWRMPVGPGLSAAEKSHDWSVLSDNERQVLLGMLDALCGRATAAERLPDGFGGAAKALRADALASQRSRRVRRLLGRLVRRR